MRQKLKRLADSIYQHNGGKPAIPPESRLAPVPEPIKVPEAQTKITGKGFSFLWLAAGVVFLSLVWVFLARKKKGQR